MRSWTQESFERARAARPDSDILWLSSRSAPAKPHGAITRAGLKTGQLSIYVAGGIAMSAMVPGTALAPVGEARASFEPFRLAALPSVTVSFPATPKVFAESEEERLDRLFATASAEVDQFLRFGAREVPRPIVKAIVKAAITTKVDPIYLMALADKESSFRSDVKASTSSAQGLFQFIDRTWLEVVRRFGADYGLTEEAAAITIGAERERPVVADEAMRTRILALRRDPYLAAVMAAEMLKKDAEEIGLKIGRTLNTTEMYLAHFLGIEDAARFIALREDKKPPIASSIFPAAARANVAIFYGTAKRGKKGRWTRVGLSVPEVYSKIETMMDSRIQRFGPVAVYASAAPQH